MKVKVEIDGMVDGKQLPGPAKFEVECEAFIYGYTVDKGTVEHGIGRSDYVIYLIEKLRMKWLREMLQLDSEKKNGND